MSTSYYKLKEPVTSIRPEVMGGHTHVGIWVNHGKAGTLVFRNEEWEDDGIWLFVNDRKSAPMHVSWGGIDTGLVVRDHPGLPSDQQMISEGGTLTTVGEIRAEAGRGKR